MITVNDFPFINENIKKNKKVHSILKSIIDNSDILKDYNLEIKIFKKGIELKSNE